jgi:hypothetical protein
VAASQLVGIALGGFGIHSYIVRSAAEPVTLIFAAASTARSQHGNCLVFRADLNDWIRFAQAVDRSRPRRRKEAQ